MVYKALNKLAPDYVKLLFTNVSDTHSRNTRSVDNALAHIPIFVHSKTRSQFLPTDSGTQSLYIRASINLDTFKSSVKNHLITCQNGKYLSYAGRVLSS